MRPELELVRGNRRDPALQPTGGRGRGRRAFTPFPRRSDPVLAALAAGLALSAVESVFALSSGWLHPASYFGLSAAITLALSLAVGAACALVGASAPVALVLWLAACGWLCAGTPQALTLSLAGAASCAPARVREARPLFLGSMAAFGLALALLHGSSVAERLQHAYEPWYEALGSALLLAGVFCGVPLLLSFLPDAVPRALPALVVLGAGLAVSAWPALERPDGTQRLPPEARAGAAPAGEERAHLFLLVLDTVRADHLSVYGYRRETTPELARWIRRRENARVFPQAYANATWTVESHASLFTGRLPHEHGAHFALDGSLRYGFAVADGLPTLAEALSSTGHATLAAYANHWLHSVQGFDRGFDRYLMTIDSEGLPFVGEALRSRCVPGLFAEAVKGGARANEVNAALLSMIEPWSRRPAPLFVFANYGDAHGPYAAPPPFRGRFAPLDLRERPEHLSLALAPRRLEELEARYDEELAYLDHELGRFLAELERLGLLDRSWIFITSDHGEAFGEHGALEHGTTVHNEVVRVPLIVFPPRGETLPSDSGPVSLVDVAATLAALGGSDLGGPGRDLRQPRPIDAGVGIEFYGDPVKAAFQGELALRPARVVLSGRYKLIASRAPDGSGEELFLYDVERDEGENVNLARALPRVVEQLRGRLPDFGEPDLRAWGVRPTAEALEQLRELGYGGAVE